MITSSDRNNIQTGIFTMFIFLLQNAAEIARKQFKKSCSRVWWMVAVQMLQVWMSSELQEWSVIYFSTLFFFWCLVMIYSMTTFQNPMLLLLDLCFVIWFLLANNIISATIMQWVHLKSKWFRKICKITHSPKWLKFLTILSSNKSNLAICEKLVELCIDSNFKMNFTLYTL